MSKYITAVTSSDADANVSLLADFQWRGWRLSAEFSEFQQYQHHQYQHLAWLHLKRINKSTALFH